jgi:hypothetical protein
MSSPSEEYKGNGDNTAVTQKSFQLLSKKVDKIGDVASKNMLKSVELMETFTKRLEAIETRLLSSPGIINQDKATIGYAVTPAKSESSKDLKSPWKDLKKTDSSKKSDSKTVTPSESSSKKSSTDSSKKQLSLKLPIATEAIAIEPAVPVVKEPKKIYVSYKINLISEINAILSTFLIDVKIFFTWTDEALIGVKKINDEEYFGNKKYFDPQIFVTNGHDLNEKSKTIKITNEETGEVKLTVHYVGSVYMTSMNLRLFPFDCQNLQLQLKPYKLPIEDVIFAQRPSADSCIEHHVSHEWNLSGHCMKVYKTDPLTSSVGKQYSTVFITVLTQRKSNWFTANIFIPSFILLLLSWLVYTIDPVNIGNRNELALATLTALIANKYVVADQLPKVDYRTMVDFYLDGIFLLQGLTTVSNSYIAHFQNVPAVNHYFFWKSAAKCVAAAGVTCVKPPSLIFNPIGWLITLYFDTLNIQFFMLQLVLGLGLHIWMGVTLYDHSLDVEKWIQDANDENDLNATLTEDGIPAPSGKKVLSLDALTSEPGADNSGGQSPMNTEGDMTARGRKTSRLDLMSPTGQRGSRRSSFAPTPESLISHEKILALKSWFPSLVSKDESHFTKFGASTLAAFIGDRDKTLLEEKAYIKKSRSLKRELTSNIVSSVILILLFLPNPVLMMTVRASQRH